MPLPDIRASKIRWHYAVQYSFSISGTKKSSNKITEELENAQHVSTSATMYILLRVTNDDAICWAQYLCCTLPFAGVM